MKQYTKLIYLFIFILILFTLLKLFPKKQIKIQVSSPVPFQNLFLATVKERQVTIYLYNFKTQQFKQKDFKIDDPISRNTHIKYDNANYSIQFNPDNQDIFVLTDGYDGTQVTPCVNKDQSCKKRIYKTNLNNLKIDFLFETDKEINNWILDPITNSITLIDYIDNETFLENISADTGKLRYSQLYSGYSGTLVVPDNGYVYQTFTTTNQNSKNYDLKLYEINTKNGSIKQTKTIDSDSFFTHQTSISQNSQYLAYYKFDNQTKQKFLSIYDFTKNSTTFKFPVGNVDVIDLYWSQNSSQILHKQNNSYWLYNLNTQKDEKIIDKRKIYAWNSNFFQIIAENDQNQLIIYDSQTKTETAFPSPITESDTYSIALF